MASTPNAFSQSVANNALLTDLGLLSPETSTYDGFIQRYPDLSKQSYIMQVEAQGRISKTENRDFYWWENPGRALPAWVANANVAAPGVLTDPITVTLGAGSYYVSGTKSPVAVGQFYRNESNGNIYRVSAVNKGTANAHTATMSPIDTPTVGNVTAGDSFVFMGVFEGEASTTRDGLYIAPTQLTNEVITIRSTQKYTDWEKQNVIRIKDSAGNFTGFDKLNDGVEIERFLQTQEVWLAQGKPFTNLDSTVGDIPNKSFLSQITEAYTSATTVDDAFFAELKRRSDANGFTNHYDFLYDTEFMIKVNNYVNSTYNNGAIVYVAPEQSGKPMSIARNFKSLNIYDLQLDFFNYAFFNSAKTWGIATGVGTYRNFGVMVPQGEMADAKTGLMVPRFGVRYVPVSGYLGADMIKVIRTGALAPIATDQELSVTVSHVTNKAVQLFAATGFLKVDLNVA